jgi:hypothetical protein
MMTRARPARQRLIRQLAADARGGRAEYLPTLLIVQHRQAFDHFHRPLVAHVEA